MFQLILKQFLYKSLKTILIIWVLTKQFNNKLGYYLSLPLYCIYISVKKNIF